MPIPINLDHLLLPIRTAIDEAYEEGYSHGYTAAVSKLVASVEAMAPTAVKPNGQGEREATESVDTDKADDLSAYRSNAPQPRAPRGALDEILERVLAEKPGMTTQEIEAAVAHDDPRIAIKSVYNRLRHFEKTGRRFRRHNSRWYRVGDIPPSFPVVSSSLRSETGGVAPPVPSTVI
jgi:hypothetical protein